MKGIFQVICEATQPMQPGQAKTLYDCLQNCITTYALKRTLGPTHVPEIVATAKWIKKNYKTQPILTVTGKKSAQSMMSDMFMGLASQVEVDWSLQPQERIDDIQKKMKDLALNAAKEAGQDNSGISFWFDLDPLTYRNGSGRDSHGVKWEGKVATQKKGVALTIEVHYKFGTFTINIAPSCALIAPAMK